MMNAVYTRSWREVEMRDVEMSDVMDGWLPIFRGNDGPLAFA
jgi:hypothetical protein